MLKGTCPGCEEVYYGWALMLEENTWCECGDRLEIKEEERDEKQDDQDELFGYPGRSSGV